VNIIPVIDLKAGTVIRGIAGQRESYRPVESILSCDATPKSVAHAFVDHFGFQTVYVADLDAISGHEPNWAAYEAIASSGLQLLVDAGTNSIERATQFVDCSLAYPWCVGVVIALESLRCEQDLLRLHNTLGTELSIFSLDLQSGNPITTIPKWNAARPMSIAKYAVAAGFQRMIILDLASVGVGKGIPVQSLCMTLREKFPQLEITSGGGVRDFADLKKLESSGCGNALVASALHNGQLSASDIAEYHRQTSLPVVNKGLNAPRTKHGFARIRQDERSQ
jgi:phosphoribosylformimino-5-aminoimidazole carboxamide ribotide isomerase